MTTLTHVPPPNNDRMLRILLTAFLIVMVMWMATAPSGCDTTQTPRQTYATVNDTFIAATQTLIVAAETGEFTQDEWNTRVLPLINAGNDLLTQYGVVTKTGVDGQNILFQIRDILIALQPYVVRASD